MTLDALLMTIITCFVFFLHAALVTHATPVQMVVEAHQ